MDIRPEQKVTLGDARQDFNRIAALADKEG